MAAAKKKRRISKEESAALAPLVNDLNKLAKDFVGIFKKRNEEKEKRVSVLISQIKSPKKGKGGKRSFRPKEATCNKRKNPHYKRRKKRPDNNS